MLCSLTPVHSATFFSTDFAGELPAELNVDAGDVAYIQRPFEYAGSGNSSEGDADIDVTALGLSGEWLFTPIAGTYNATLSLTGLGPHSSLDIGLFLHAGGGLDGIDGGQDDGLEIIVDGTTVFHEHFGGRSPDREGYGDTPAGQAAALIRKSGQAAAPVSNLNSYREGGWGHDALYDLSLDPSLQGIAHTASTATIQFIVNRNEADTDEYFGLANLVVSDSGPGRAFEITAFDYSADTRTVTLTWPSSPTETFAVKYSTDMIDWGADLDDNVSADAGESTTATFKLPVDLVETLRVYFRIEKL